MSFVLVTVPKNCEIVKYLKICEIANKYTIIRFSQHLKENEHHKVITAHKAHTSECNVEKVIAEKVLRKYSNASSSLIYIKLKK